MRKTFAGVGAWRILQGGADMLNQVIHGDCLEVLRTMPDNSVDEEYCEIARRRIEQHKTQIERR